MTDEKNTDALIKVDQEIDQVAMKIENTEAKWEAATTDKERDFFEKSLTALRKKEEQLREKEILLLRQSAPPGSRCVL